MPDEPADGDESSTKVVLRLPLSGERVQRNFLKTDRLQMLYDFIDHLQNEDKCKFDGVESYTDRYQIVQIRPRVVYADKEKTLEELGLWPKGPVL